MSNDVPSEGQVIATVNRLQRLARYDNRPTQKIVLQTLRKESGIDYEWDILDDVLRRLESQDVLFRYPGTYKRSVRWVINPHYVPDESAGGDPYTKEQREFVTMRNLPTWDERQKAEAESKRKQAEIRNRERNIWRRRTKAREGIDPYKILGKLYEAGDLESPEVMKILEEDPGSVFVIDVETTGLSAYDSDVLELSIINGGGRTVHTARYDSWFDEWPEAERIHGIRPEDVKGLPKLEDDAAKISGLLRRARVLVGYNVHFDLDFMASAGIQFPTVPCCDVMEEFSYIYGEWADWIDEGRGGYLWKKLTTAGKYYKIDTTGAHGSLKDCQITLEVLKHVAKEPESKRHRPEPAD